MEIEVGAKDLGEEDEVEFAAGTGRREERIESCEGIVGVIDTRGAGLWASFEETFERFE